MGSTTKNKEEDEDEGYNEQQEEENKRERTRTRTRTMKIKKDRKTERQKQAGKELHCTHFERHTQHTTKVKILGIANTYKLAQKFMVPRKLKN
jgi:hypothetical protein